MERGKEKMRKKGRGERERRKRRRKKVERRKGKDYKRHPGCFWRKLQK